MLSVYVIEYCRYVIIAVFLVSFFAKVVNTAQFENSISGFALLPQSYTKFVAILVLLGEFFVVVASVIGGSLLWLAFVSAALLLTIFGFAIAAILKRGIRTSCNCFGVSSNFVSYYDILRNVGLVMFAMVGWLTLSYSASIEYAIPLLERVAIALAAIIFVVIWIHLKEVVKVFEVR
jgi:hypothetical protein